MRLWLKDSERRLDPAPVKTDDRKPVLLGLGVWLVALVLAIVFLEPLAASGFTWWLWTAVAGLVTGLIGLVYTHLRHSK